ncbi:hypothetical protein K0504_06310 [Neiella marina]|uniref:Uncharacterized protein n=1 Tax=Neiella holothuriorum TaxID=2870530 RepID=A0ABS7EFT2_9GAMM|nr:hypothetical protein [Neiella holothuriorum]MBW8190646.1 hypothetical protein [Neiella holothuriorum]
MKRPEPPPFAKMIEPSQLLAVAKKANAYQASLECLLPYLCLCTARTPTALKDASGEDSSDYKLMMQGGKSFIRLYIKLRKYDEAVHVDLELPDVLTPAIEQLREIEPNDWEALITRANSQLGDGITLIRLAAQYRYYRTNGGVDFSIIMMIIGRYTYAANHYFPFTLMELQHEFSEWQLQWSPSRGKDS